MIFKETKLAGAYLISLQLIEDDRGFFARTWCRDEFAAHNLNTRLVQANVSHNRLRGTLRGLHYQAAPYAETKVVRCIRGAIYDVIVDIRESSPSYLDWIGVELTEANREMVYVPEGFAHGFQTLSDGSEVEYQMSEFFNADAAGGLRYDDPAIGIKWPLPVETISTKDASWPLLEVSVPGGLAR
jgi:dTDP-4-dehydrorhamnose 3,5-epimerase